jgi:hypothetical protein
MSLPTCEIDKNSACVTVLGVDVYFSYRTPIAFRAGGGLVVRENAWGPTTGKHLNRIDGGDKEAKAARVCGERFAAMWAEIEQENVATV